MSKMLRWYKTGEPIPDDAVYIRSEIRRENVKWNHGSDNMGYSDYETWDTVEYHLYEVKLP